MKLKITLLALFSCALLFAQNFKEEQLPTPDKLNPFYIGPLFTSTIHYGVTPPNYNGKVILFNHGYIDLNQTQFLFDNSFYKEVYKEGYQAVFVATTRGGGIWVNGELLAEAIDIVTDKYNVDDVTIIAHSNGGKASEAAMIHYGKKNKVNQVFALGTPYWGTYLANISQFPLLNWAWKLTGLNEGAVTSTTYYCRDVVRPYFDNNPNNEPEKFVVLGSCGYFLGSNLLARAAFTATGNVLLPVQGANDGVAPYRSTLRPGAEYVFRKNDSRAFFDHLDVSLGKFSWPYVKMYMQNRAAQSNVLVSENTNPYKTESDYYILYSDNEYDKVVFDKNSSFAIANIIHEDPTATFNIFDQQGKNLTTTKQYSEKPNATTITLTENNTTLKSDSRFAAFIKQDNSIKMTLELQPAEHPILKVDFSAGAKNLETPESIEVRGILTKTATINGTSLREIPQVVSFQKKEDGYYLNTQNLDDGVYNIFLNGESKGNFKRSIISGFVVGNINEGLATTATQENLASTTTSINITPNAVKDFATLNISSDINKDQLQVNIYDITGKKINAFELKNNQQRSFDISNQLAPLAGGIYILQLNDNQTFKFVKE
ncbi:T9SS type A sorting domain-containing protein [Aquimarina brevivitae]|nr:T9SS type A sorting domain-containing protein [Aquimarina brevivitae]